MEDILLTPTQILLIDCEFTVPPKPKFLLLTASKEALLYFFPINSKINNYILIREELLKCQVTIEKNKHSFLKYDSFIDCSRLIKLYRAAIINQINSQKNRIKDFLHYETKQEVISAIAFSPTISPNDKKLILQSLSPIKTPEKV